MAVTIGEAVEAYEAHARSLGLADSYVRIQMSYLTRFAECCNGIQAKSLTPLHIARFYDTLPNTSGSHNRALSALRGFVVYLERMRHVKQGSTGFLLGDRKTRKFTRLPKYYIPVSQFGPMIAAARRRHWVDGITLALAFYTLARQGEIANLRLKDVDLDNLTIRIYRQKRRRWTIVQMCPELRDEIFIWLNVYADSTGYTGRPLGVQDMMREHPDWFLAPALECIRGRRDDGPFDASKTTYRVIPDQEAGRLEDLVKRMLDIFGAKTEDGKSVKHKGEGMHTIRRSGARAMIDYLSGVWNDDRALLMVSTMLDHDTTVMTLSYIGRSLEQKRLNTYLAGHSMYGDHGRAYPAGSNVTRLPLDGPGSHGDGLGRSEGIGLGSGEVDAL
jgi:integrase